MWIIPLDHKLVNLPPVNATPFLPRNLEHGEIARLPLQLRLQGIDVIAVDVRVTHDLRQTARDEVADVRNHVREQSIAGDVEGDTQTHVAGSLVQLAVKVSLLFLHVPVPVSVTGSVGLFFHLVLLFFLQLVCGLLPLPPPPPLLLLLLPRIGDVELGKHVTRREGHLGQVGWVPGRQDDSAVVRARLELPDDLGQLIHALPRIVRLRIDVVGAKVAPLEPVDGAQVADIPVAQADAVEELARAVAVPDPDARLAQGEGGRVGLDEPQQLGDDGLGEDALGCEEGEDRGAVPVEGESQGSRGEERERSRSGSVVVRKTSAIDGPHLP